MAKEKSISKKAADAKKSNGTQHTAETSAATETSIHVITDGTGGLPRHILAAVLSQFPNLNSAPQYHIFCDSTDQVDRELRKIQCKSIVLHALANPTTKQHLI
jgi:regulator of PEP synthase PpsR (kinase-PPPase family)